MLRSSRVLSAFAVLGLLATTLSPALAVPKSSAPPAPPKVRKFPKRTTKPPVARIIRLEPGQKRITPEQLRKAPTVDVANRRGKASEAHRPAPSTPAIPGTPAILRGISAKTPSAKLAPPAAKPPVKPKSR